MRCLVCGHVSGDMFCWVFFRSQLGVPNTSKTLEHAILTSKPFVFRAAVTVLPNGKSRDEYDIISDLNIEENSKKKRFEN